MRLVVIGGDAAGMSAAHTALRAARAAGLTPGEDVEVVVLEMTEHTSYSACGLPYWIADDVASSDDLVARTPGQHREMGVDLRLFAPATAIDLDKRTVTSGFEGEGSPLTELAYDALVLATGAEPRSPAWALGEDGDRITGVSSVKTIDDGHVVRHLVGRVGAEAARRAVVVGGGYIGIEMAEAMVERGFETTLLARSRVMKSLDPDMSARVVDGLRAAGVEVREGVDVAALEQAPDPAGFSVGATRVSAVVTADGDTLPTDLVVVAAGVAPRTELGAAAGLPVGAAGGYLPDSNGRVAPRVWAAGDCCEYVHRMTGERVAAALGTHANKLGRLVGDDVGRFLTSPDPASPGRLGGSGGFGGVLGTAITRFVAGGQHLEIARTGLSTQEATAAGFDVTALVTEGTTASGYMPEATPIATKVLADRSSRRLLGVQIVGGVAAGKRIDAAAAALWGSMSIDDLAGMDLAYAPPFATVWDALQIAARRLAERL